MTGSRHDVAAACGNGRGIVLTLPRLTLAAPIVVISQHVVVHTGFEGGGALLDAHGLRRIGLLRSRSMTSVAEKLRVFGVIVVVVCVYCQWMRPQIFSGRITPNPFLRPLLCFRKAGLVQRPRLVLAT